MDVYRPDDIIIDFGGFQIHGFAKGTFVKVAQNEDDATLNVGGDGEGSVVVNLNDSAVVTFTLKRSSAANDILSAKRAAFKAGGGADPILIKDLKGTTMHHAEHAWVKKIADSEFSSEETQREWVLEVEKMESLVGGRF